MITRHLAATPAQGARSILFAATSPEVRGGDFIGPRSGLRGPPARVRSSDRSHDPDLARHLWLPGPQRPADRHAAPLPNRPSPQHPHPESSGQMRWIPCSPPGKAIGPPGKAIGALRRLEKRPGLVWAFFAEPHLRYITA